MENIKYIPFLPIAALSELKCSSDEMLISGIVASFAKEGKPLICSYDYLAQQLNISNSTTKRVVKKLVEKGLITKDSGLKERNANKYYATSKLKKIYNLNDSVKMNLSQSNDSVKMTSNRLPKGNQYDGGGFFSKTPPSEEEIEMEKAMNELCGYETKN
jgi:DNA-binding MarR family transcriptional regulator